MLKLAVIGLQLVLLLGQAEAHSSEFIFAKLCLEPGSIGLELTADYGENPLLQTEAEAAAALRQILQVRTGSSVHSLEELGTLRFEKRAQIDPTCPLPKTADESKDSHWLLTALWTAKAPASTLQLSIPEGSPHSVILWNRDDTRWLFLMAGEHSPSITIPNRHPSARWLTGLSLGLALAAGLWWRIKSPPPILPAASHAPI